MKRFIRNAVALAIGTVLGSCTVAAYAAQYQTPNAGGGAMVVTDEPCVVAGKNYENLRRAFSFIATGESIEGCWGRVSEEVIRIIWIGPDGEAVAQDYPIAAFRKVTAI